MARPTGLLAGDVIRQASILMTLAPQSASWRTQVGPERTRVRSSTVKRERACEARGNGIWNSGVDQGRDSIVGATIAVFSWACRKAQRTLPRAAMAQIRITEGVSVRQQLPAVSDCRFSSAKSAVSGGNERPRSRFCNPAELSTSFRRAGSPLTTPEGFGP
jgi:hypothetical protein